MNDLIFSPHDSKSLFGMNVKWNYNWLFKATSVDISFSPDHVFPLNDQQKRKELKLDLTDERNYRLRFFKSEEEKEPYFVLALTDDKSEVIALEKIMVKNSVLGKNSEQCRLTVIYESGYSRTEIHGTYYAASRRLKVLIDLHNSILERRAMSGYRYDKFMRKYFPAINGRSVFDRLMYKYFSFYG